jgi:hypothetical protein
VTILGGSGAMAMPGATLKSFTLLCLIPIIGYVRRRQGLKELLPVIAALSAFLKRKLQGST